ncbi:MAG: hypothetical protein J6Y60_03485 [Treponema sp.]|nr:hypothetical protein [Treponema sp.]
MERFENIDKRMKKELSKLDKKYENDSSEMSSQDLELADCLFHALKSAETYYAMQESGEGGYSGEYGGSGRSYGNSYARGRDSRGRYTSREMSRDGGYSGHYPMMPYGYSGEYERW